MNFKDANILRLFYFYIDIIITKYKYFIIVLSKFILVNASFLELSIYIWASKPIVAYKIDSSHNYSSMVL